MNVHDDVARFRADDDERLVAASFACPVASVSTRTPA